MGAIALVAWWADDRQPAAVRLVILVILAALLHAFAFARLGKDQADRQIRDNARAKPGVHAPNAPPNLPRF